MDTSKVVGIIQLDGMNKIVKSNVLEELARTTVKLSRIDYEDNIRYYKTIVENLKKEKGIE